MIVKRVLAGASPPGSESDGNSGYFLYRLPDGASASTPSGDLYR